MWLMSLTLASACEPTTDAELDAILDRALAGYENLDQGAFEAALADARTSVDCLSEPIRPSVAARLHRLGGLEAFGRRELALAEQRFAASRLAEPTAELDRTLIPATSPVREHHQALDVDALEVVPLPRPADGAVLLDGTLTRSYRPALPVVFQRTADTGELIESRMLAAGAPVPGYAVAPPPRPTGSDRVKRRMGPSGPLLAGGVVAAIGSLALNVAARSAKRSLDPGMTPEKQQGVQLRANGLSVGNIGLGVAAAGLGAGALVLWDF